jgi:hypothetical protein
MALHQQAAAVAVEYLYLRRQAAAVVVVAQQTKPRLLAPTVLVGKEIEAVMGPQTQTRFSMAAAEVGQGLQAAMLLLAQTDKEEQVYSPLSLAQPLITQAAAVVAPQVPLRLPAVDLEAEVAQALGP